MGMPGYMKPVLAIWAASMAFMFTSPAQAQGIGGETMKLTHVLHRQ